MTAPAVTLTTQLGPLEAAVRAAAADAQRERVIERIWDVDDTVFGPAGQPEVADRLGWLRSPERSRELLPQLDELAAGARERGDRVVLVLGMGGSSLAPEVLSRAFHSTGGAPELRVLDSTVPAAVLAAVAGLDLKHTLVLAASKSGSTVETRSKLELLWEQFEHRGDAFAVVTDPGSELERLAAERGFRAVVHGDPEVGGRFSALTAFGLTPAAVAGIDVRTLLDGGAAAAQTGRSADPAQNPALHLGLAIAEAARAGRDKLTVLAEPSLGNVELWLEQLIAESTGKHGVGVLPVAGEPAGGDAHYGDDRVVLRVRDGARTSGALDAAALRLQQQGAPVLTLQTDGPAGLGGIFWLAELATAVAGWRLGINPFDQPNVQSAKDATKAVLAGAGGGIPLPDTDARSAIGELLDGLGAPGYVGILAYVAPTPSTDQAAQRLQGAIRDATGAAVTFGYGPRYLHSTGQLHKGGAAGGRFLIVVDDASPDVAIPGAGHGFRTLAHAQAVGDLNALRDAGRVATLVTTGGAPAETLHALADSAARRY